MEHRFLLILWCFLAIAVAFALRISTAIAMIEMVTPKTNYSQEYTFDYCFAVTCTDSEIEENEIQMNWTENQIGLITGAFAFSWIFVQIPFGVMADVIPTKLICGIGMICASVLTVCLPYTITTENNFVSTIIMRCAIGFFEGPLFCSINSIISKWFPSDEIWLASGIIYSGIPFGGIISSLCGFAIYNKKLWSSHFIILGIIGIIIYVLFLALVYDTPDTHPWITKREKDYLAAELGAPIKIKLKEIPWRNILLNNPFRGLILSRLGLGFGFNILINYLPQYYSNVLCLDLYGTVTYTIIPFVCAFATGILSIVHGFNQTKREISTASMRKFLFVFSSIVPAIFLLAGSFFNCDDIAVLISFTIAMCGLGFYVIGIYTNEVLLSITYCGTLTGITNTVGGIVDIAGPLVTGVFTKTDSVTEWRLVFWICFMLFNACSLPYMVWGSPKAQHFDGDSAQADNEN